MRIKDLKAVKSSATPKKRVTTAPKISQKRFIRLALFVVALVVIGLSVTVVVQNVFFSNPLLGTWRTQTTMGIREIVFERGSMTSFGTKAPVSYDIKEKQVVVMDVSLQLGTLYTLVDKDTISAQMGKSKIVYKRVR